MKKEFSQLLSHAVNGKINQDLSIRDRIVIREDFKSLIPPLSIEELCQLEENIAKERVRDPLILWKQGDQYVLIDGHNRFEICKRLQLEFPFEVRSFINEEEVKDWMLSNQLGRRNLSPEQQSYLRGLKYNSRKAQGKRTDLTSDQNDPKSSVSTAASLAKEYNVGEATIKRDGEFAQALDKIGTPNPDLKNEILSGKAKLKRKQIIELARQGEQIMNENSVQQGKVTNPRRRIAEVALEYIKTEKRPIEVVAKVLGFDLDRLDPDKFLRRWYELQNNT